MTRKDAREFAMQTLFQMDIQQAMTAESVETFMGAKALGDQKEYVSTLLAAICDHLEDIDAVINASSEGWPASRMVKTDLAILRIAVGEIKYMDNVPKAVAINEAVNLAKTYSADHSPGFVNAVLGKIEG